MNGISKFVLRDADILLSAALAFALEFSPNESVKTIQKPKPIHYFSRQDSDILLDDYQPQCDQMETTIDDEVTIIQNTMTLDCNDDDIEVIGVVKAPPKVRARRRPIRSQKESPKQPTKEPTPPRTATQPTRRSSRVLIRTLAEEENNRKKKKSTPKPKIQRNETYLQKLRTRRDNNKTVNEERKQRKIIEEATRSTLRVFGIVGNEKTRSGEANVTAWRNWKKTSNEILQKIMRSSSASTFRESHFTIFISNSVIAMEKTMIAARPRSAETHNLMLNFIVDFHMIWEIASKHEVESGIYDIGMLIENVIGKYLSSDKLMHPTHLPWIQTKQIFEQLLSIIVKIDVIFDLLALVSRMMNVFLTKHIHRTHTHEEFKAYAISQLTEFSQILSRRLTHLALKNKYHI